MRPLRQFSVRLLANFITLIVVVCYLGIPPPAGGDLPHHKAGDTGVHPIISYLKNFGGGWDDQANGVGVDRWGNAYVTGYTQSDKFPTLNAFQAKRAAGKCDSGDWGLVPCRDAFVMKLDPTGRIIYSTYLGGSADDLAMPMWRE
jgi:hypothetical protein